jgi:sugar phosphate isomerase/epimerase
VSHVHLKDIDEGGDWTRIGEGVIDYPGQLRALEDDGYAGFLSLETHYTTPAGGAESATRESIAAVRRICDRVGVDLTP